MYRHQRNAFKPELLDRRAQFTQHLCRLDETVFVGQVFFVLLYVGFFLLILVLYEFVPAQAITDMLCHGLVVSRSTNLVMNAVLVLCAFIKNRRNGRRTWHRPVAVVILRHIICIAAIPICKTHSVAPNRLIPGLASFRHRNFQHPNRVGPSQINLRQLQPAKPDAVTTFAPSSPENQRRLQSPP